MENEFKILIEFISEVDIQMMYYVSKTHYGYGTTTSELLEKYSYSMLDEIVINKSNYKEAKYYSEKLFFISDQLKDTITQSSIERLELEQLKLEADENKSIFKEGVINQIEFLKNQIEVFRHLRFMTNQLENKINNQIKEIEPEPAPAKRGRGQETTIAQQIKLLKDIGFIHHYYFKENYTKERLSEILSKILNRNSQSIREYLTYYNKELSEIPDKQKDLFLDTPENIEFSKEILNKD